MHDILTVSTVHAICRGMSECAYRLLPTCLTNVPVLCYSAAAMLSFVDVVSASTSTHCIRASLAGMPSMPCKAMQRKYLGTTSFQLTQLYTCLNTHLAFTILQQGNAKNILF